MEGCHTISRWLHTMVQSRKFVVFGCTLLKKIARWVQKWTTQVCTELVLDGRTWYLGHVSTTHMYLSMYSITIYMYHWFYCDLSILVMDNIIPIYLFSSSTVYFMMLHWGWGFHNHPDVSSKHYSSTNIRSFSNENVIQIQKTTKSKILYLQMKIVYEKR